MSRTMTWKEEWLRCSGWDSSTEKIRLREKIAALSDLENPNEAQQRLLHMADLRLTLMDLPLGARPNHEAELLALARAEFGNLSD
jgi:hypothetical protein